MKQTIEVKVIQHPRVPDFVLVIWPGGEDTVMTKLQAKSRRLEIPETTYTVMVSLTRDEIEARASRGQGTRFTTVMGSAGKKLDEACREYLNRYTIDDCIEHST